MAECQYDRTLLHGLDEIAAYCGVSVYTIRRWHRKHGYPICKAPDGKYLGSTALTDEWIQARGIVQNRARELGKS